MNELDLFAAAIAIADSDERARLLDRECTGHPQLRERLEQLIAAHLRAKPLLDQATVDFSSAGQQPNDSAGLEPTREIAAAMKAGAIIAGRYVLLEQIGEGGMGEVWVAEQKEPVKRRVAVKLIKAGMDSRAVLARFDAERQALAVMDDLHIAKVLDGGTTVQGRPFFVMELVRGIPLTDYCDQTQLTVRERLELFGQVCSAVQHAHQKGIIHRDLKPSNILVTEYDGQPVCKVIDFGLAKALHGAHALTDMSLHTAFGAVIGTPLYMAPEQLGTSALDVDTRSDLYSLGVILYELLTGTTPIERQRLKEAAWDEIRRIVREEEPPRPSQRLSSSDTLPNLAARRHVEPAKLPSLVRGELDWIIMKALEKDRNRRYETANSLALDIQRHLAGEAVLAAPPSRVYRLRKLVRRNRGPVLAASLLLLALLGGIAGTTFGLLQAQAAAEAERLAKVDAQEQKTEADDQRNRAEQREQEAINAVKQFGNVVANNSDLKSNPQLESLRKTLLQEPLGFFRSLRERLQADPDTRPESLNRLASAAFSLGDITDEIGNKQDALQAYEQAKSILEQLVRANPTVTKFQSELANSHINIGILLSDTGKLDEALAAYEQARSIQAQLVRANPTVTQFQSVLAASHHNIGILLRETGKLTEALAAFGQARAILEQLVRANPTVTRFQSDLAASQISIGILLSDTGKPDEALGAYEQAGAIFEHLVRVKPTVTQFQRGLAGSHNNIGTLLVATGKPIEALAAFERAKSVQEKLVRENPTVSELQSNLAISHSNIGRLLNETGKPIEALAAYEQASSIQEQLVRANPTVTEFQSGLASSHHNIGNLLRKTGKPTEALPALELARSIREQLVRANPAVTEFQSDLADSHEGIGFLLGQAGKPDEALAAYDQGRSIRVQLVRANPTVTQFHSALAASYNNFGVQLSRIGKPTEALAAYERARDIQEQLVHANPTITEFQSRLGQSYNQMSSMLREMGRLTEALAACEQARSIREQLMRTNPTVIGFRSDLGGTLSNLATIENDLGKFDDARDHLREAIKWQKQALGTNLANPAYRQALKTHFASLLSTAAGLGDASLAAEARQGLAELAASDPQFAELDKRVAAVVAGDKAQGAEELLAFAKRAYDTQQFALAARFFAEALESDVTLAEDRQTQVAYKAACCAVLAGCGQGLDDPQPDERTRAKLRGQALGWLQTELDRWTRALESATPDQRQFIAQTLAQWQNASDLSGIRGDAIATLPEVERESWQTLWTSVQQTFDSIESRVVTPE